MESLEITDERLLANHIAGCNESFAFLYERHHRKLQRIMRKYVRDHDIADDIVQSTFMKLHEHANRFSENCNVTKTIFTIALNEAKTYLRKKRETVTTVIEPVIDDDPSIVAEDSEIAENIQMTLDKMSPFDRVAINLAFFEGKSNKEISQTLQMSNSNVRVRLVAAIGRFRSIWSWSKERTHV